MRRPDEIKKAFRREIARYHPDKVQHLGPGVPGDGLGHRRRSDRGLPDPDGPGAAGEVQRGPVRRTRRRRRRGRRALSRRRRLPDPSRRLPRRRSVVLVRVVLRPARASPRQRGASSGAGVEFVKKASLSRVKDAVEDVMGDAESGHVTRASTWRSSSKPKRRPVQEGGRRDPPAGRSSCRSSTPRRSPTCWAERDERQARRTRPLCVLLMGPGLAPAKDLATRDQRAAPEGPECRSCARAGRCERLGGTVSPGYAGAGPVADSAARRKRSAEPGTVRAPFA